MAEKMTSGFSGTEGDKAELSALYQDCLDHMSITWEPDPAMKRNIEHKMEEAMAYLRKRAGCPGLSFREGENRNLFKTCVWYFVENQRAEFEREYSGELTMLRLREGFGCGKTEESKV